MGRRETTVQVEPAESKPQVPAEPVPAEPLGETPSQPPSIQATVEVVAAAEGPARSVPARDESTPEIREVGSQLAELSTSEATEVKPAIVSEATEVKPTASRAESEPVLVEQDATTQARPPPIVS